MIQILIVNDRGDLSASLHNNNAEAVYQLKSEAALAGLALPDDLVAITARR